MNIIVDVYVRTCIAARLGGILPTDVPKPGQRIVLILLSACSLLWLMTDLEY